MPPPLSTRYRTAFVTGASSGLGRAFAEMLLAEGVRVWGTSRDTARLVPLVQKHPAAFTPVALDLADGDAAETAYARAATQAAATQAAADAAPGFDLVINNAGFGRFSPFAEVRDFAVWQAQLDAMLTHTARLAHAALRGMTARRRGCLVNVSSLAAEFPLPLMAGYNIAKAGLSALSESLMFELRGTPLVVMDFRPGDYRTAFNEVIQAEAAARQAAPSSSPPSPPMPDNTDTAPRPAPAPGAPPHPPSPLRIPRPRLTRAWEALEKNLRAAPPPARAARDLRRALLRGRPGIVRSGSFFQARLAPLAARMMPARLLRAALARYFGAA
ncbi:MAG: SDR family NAD(P)-dependent oxidoreductase [Opitutaceae bacterium]|jgi:short-subunit dehydrogenase|nr:SDR family NAD(P)-dependent oxidoreductase [Opitutaceae bacterium]